MPKFVGKRKKVEEEKKSDEEEVATSSDSGPDDDPPAKKNKPDSKQAKRGGDEEASFLLSKNKFVKVRTFQGHVMIDIREFYMAADGELRPGRKGITLNPVQWEQLKGVVTKVDAAVMERI